MFLKKMKMHKHDDYGHGAGPCHHRNANGHQHKHTHHHFEIRSESDVSKSFILGGILNLIFVVIEIVIGVITGSVSLIADAVHNFSDVIALFLSWLGFRLNQTKSSPGFTFGLKKASLLIALFNAVTLLLSLGFIVYEAIERLIKPQSIPAIQVAIVAAIGVVINFSSALLFKKDKHDVNIKSAYLHLIIDAIISVAVVVSAVLMKLTGWMFLDPLMAILIVFVIAKSSWQLFKESFILTMGGVPPEINVESLKQILLKHPDVKSVHDLHVWSLSSSETAMSVHLLTEHNNFPGNKIYDEIRELISKDFRIHHITIQIELNDTGHLYQCDLVGKC